MDSNTLTWTLLKIIDDDALLEELLESAIEDGFLLNELHELVPYELKYSQAIYVRKLLNCFKRDSHQSKKLVELLLKWFLKEKYKTLEKNFKVTSRELFFAKNTISNINFFFLLSGKYQEYLKQKKDEKEVTVIPTQDYVSLKDLASKNVKYMKYENEYLEMQDKIKSSSAMLEEKENEIEDYKILLDKYPKIKIKRHLINKRILLFIGAINNEKKEKVMSEYLLKELVVVSSLESMINQIQDFDYVIFSTQMAKHSTYFQAKNMTRENFFHTDKLNIELIFEELLSYIEEKGYKGDFI